MEIVAVADIVIAITHIAKEQPQILTSRERDIWSIGKNTTSTVAN